MQLTLLGQTGYVGSWIHQTFTDQGHDIQVIKVDVTDRSAVQEALKDVRDSVVINATGKTGRPNVDWCEDHRLETTKVNVDGAINVCEIAAEQGNYVIQIGSGCIFEYREQGAELDQAIADKSVYAFTEEDEPNFFGSFYSQTKAVAESAVKEISNVCVLRIRMPLQGSSHPRSLLNKLVQYDKILSVPNSVTIMEDFMPFLEKVLEIRPTGILNAVNPGAYEHKDLLELYREIVDPSRSFEYIGLKAFEGMTKAKRSNCVLSTARCDELGVTMPAVADRLEDLMKAYKEAL